MDLPRKFKSECGHHIMGHVIGRFIRSLAEKARQAAIIAVAMIANS